MTLRRIVLSCAGLSFALSLGLSAQKINLVGEQRAQIQYQIKQRISLRPEIRELVLSFVEPVSFRSATVSQAIDQFETKFSSPPETRKLEIDELGNRRHLFYWFELPQNLTSTISFNAKTDVVLPSPFDIVRHSEDLFQLDLDNPTVPDSVKQFLDATDLVQVDDARIRNQALELAGKLNSTHEVVHRVLSWIVDHLEYVLVPAQYDALYALETGIGNCQNYSHLAAALLRSLHIPVRIVNGLTLEEPYDVPIGERVFEFEMAQGRHAWIEVYFNDLGWVPFDAQQSEYFVSNRYLRIEIGRDNAESMWDGLVRWRLHEGAEPKSPELTETISGRFISDETNYTGQFAQSGPKSLLLGPTIELPMPASIASATKVREKVSDLTVDYPVVSGALGSAKQQVPLEEPTPEPIDYTALAYTRDYTTGNLNFPLGIDLAFRHLSGVSGDSIHHLQKNFVVETAEYVTGEVEYAQQFEVAEPIRLHKIGLAMHIFGGDGRVWLTLHEDDDGDPGVPAVNSRPIRIQAGNQQPGYDWVDFDFEQEGIILGPDRYWFTIHYAGTVIANSFYSYSKHSNLTAGTRSRVPGTGDWQRVMAYEFNYRITGMAAE